VRNKEPGWAAVAATAVRRFSLLGLISVGVLLASGIVNSWYEVGSVTNLIANPCGRLVLLKLGAFRVPLLAQNGQVCLLRQPLHSPINFGC
jgi:putative copper export protein